MCGSMMGLIGGYLHTTSQQIDKDSDVVVVTNSISQYAKIFQIYNNATRLTQYIVSNNDVDGMM